MINVYLGIAFLNLLFDFEFLWCGNIVKYFITTYKICSWIYWKKYLMGFQKCYFRLQQKSFSCDICTNKKPYTLVIWKIPLILQVTECCVLDHSKFIFGFEVVRLSFYWGFKFDKIIHNLLLVFELSSAKYFSSGH